MDFFTTIEEYARKNRNKIARIYRENVITFGDLVESSDAFATYLIKRFYGEKSPIVIYGHKQNEMLISFLACTKSGHPYIPVDITFPEKRIEDIIENSGAKIVVAIDRLPPLSKGIEIISFEELNNIITDYKGHIPHKEYRVESNDLYYILYTSGSTGKPKGVQITKNCLENFISWFKKSCQISNIHGTFMDQVSYSFDVSVISLYIALLLGRTIFGIDREMILNFKELFRYLKESKIGMWISTPSFVEMCLVDQNFNKSLLPDLEKFFVAGEVLTFSLVKRIFERFGDIKIINGYGPTEATVLFTAIEMDQEQVNTFESIPLGYPMENGSIIIVNDRGEEVPEGEKGEIILIGDSVSPGYLNNPELTEKVFFTIKTDNKERRAYKTGDLGYIKNGLVYYCGRKDFQIKLNGYRIELEDIENNLRKIEFVKNAVVLPVKREDKVIHLCAFITLNKRTEEKDTKIVLKIKNELRKLLPPYMIPKHIIIKEYFPTNTSGKIDRELLLKEIR